jgi:peptidyl-prolyl cis-trans isomerase B (cyclophilin B)
VATIDNRARQEGLPTQMTRSASFTARRYHGLCRAITTLPRVRLPGFAAVAAAVALAAGCGGGDGTTTAATDTSGTSTAGCTSVERPAAKPDGGQTAPTQPLASGKTYELVFTTNCGNFTITLDVKTAPKTTASLVSLARSGFFGDTIFHRIVPGFVIQGGDPTQSGTGGPGYSTVDVPPSDAQYTKGVVAMAKTGAEPPGTSGSQFFVVTGADAGLPPDYAVVGKVTEGLDVVERIGELGDASEQPTQPVVIEKVTVQES